MVYSCSLGFASRQRVSMHSPFRLSDSKTSVLLITEEEPPESRRCGLGALNAKRRIERVWW
jgi:hypothetical protein